MEPADVLSAMRAHSLKELHGPWPVRDAGRITEAERAVVRVPGTSSGLCRRFGRL
jgi:hypothetical protein